jgi:hypothetical protein
MFFDEHLVEFQDFLQINLEPIKPSFPLSPEGSMILKSKISHIIEKVFKDEDVDSKVENIFVTNMFAN